MSDYLRRTWAEIDLDALSYNVEQIQKRLAPGCGMLGVVKADAYGHGAQQVAGVLAQHGTAWFGVSNIEEGVALRNSGFAQPILIFGTTPPELAGELAQQRITQAVYSLEYARALQQQAEAAGAVVDCHIKLDTGMTRLGFLCDDEQFERSMAEIEEIAGFANLRLGGAFTHFASADDYEGDAPDYTRMQFNRFQRAVAHLRVRGLALPVRHCANSAAVISYPEMHLELARPGIILYGIDPSDQCAGRLDYRPVMSLKSTVASIKRIGRGTQVSYGRTYCAPRDIDVAVVPIGYADGYSRALSGRGRMLVGGQYAPVLGRVCMDQLMIDVTGIPDVKRGDEVVAFGRQGDNAITAAELAELIGTIPYEVTCLISKRVPRVYLRDGRAVEVVNHIL